MLQAAEHFGFPLETTQMFVAGDARLDHLERHDAVRVLLLGPIDGAHPALSEHGKNAIVADAGRNLAKRTPDRAWTGRAEPGSRRKLSRIELVR